MKKNALAEYCDVGLCGDANYEREEICMIIEESKIISVVGKMKESI